MNITTLYKERIATPYYNIWKDLNNTDRDINPRHYGCDSCDDDSDVEENVNSMRKTSAFIRRFTYSIKTST